MANFMQCCFKGCGREGEPAKGFDFFACDQCLDELEHLIAAKYKDEQAKAQERAKRN